MSIISSIVPSSGHIAIFGCSKADKVRSTEFLDAARELDQDYVDAALGRLAKRGATDFYFSIGSFTWPDGTPRSRAANFATRFRSYAVDIDCHGNANEYTSPRQAIKEVLPVLIDAGLEPTRMVFTGRGIQLYWSFERDLSVSQWQDISRDMWSVLMYLGIKADPACQADRARIFRMPGTINSANGLEAVVLPGELPPLKFRAFKKKVDDYLLDHDVPLIEVEREKRPHAADAHGDVFACEQNAKRLRYILKFIPADFSNVDLTVRRPGLRSRDGYSLWRNVIWAAKRTGLPEAWELIDEWAHRAEGRYDDLDEAIDRTWDSDNSHKDVAVGPGTLARMAEAFAPVRLRRKLKKFHFLTEEEVMELDGAQDRIEEDEEIVSGEDPDYATEWEDDEPQDIAPDEFWNCREWNEDGAVDDRDIECEFCPYWMPRTPNGQPIDGDDLQFLTDEVTAPTHYADGRMVGFSGELEDAPPGEYGSPEFPLPKGFTFRYDEDGRIIGLCVSVPSDPDDPDAGEELLVISTEAVELLEADVEKTAEGNQYSYYLRRYDSLTGKPYAPFAISGSLLSSVADLAKTMSTHGVIFGPSSKAPALMSLYLKLLIEKRRAEYADRETTSQCGWTDNDAAFLLGTTKLGQKGIATSARLTQSARRAANGVGDVAGDPKVQEQLINSYGAPKLNASRAVISMMLGSVLSKFIPQHPGTVYLYCPQGGSGKSTTSKIALGLFGNPLSMLHKGNSTVTVTEVGMVAYNDLPYFADEIKMPVGSRQGDQRAASAMRDFILDTSLGAAKGRANSSGTGMTSGDGRWNAPLFCAANLSPATVVGEQEADSVEPRYNRLLVVPFQGQTGQFSSDKTKPIMAPERYRDAHGIWRERIVPTDVQAALRDHYGFVGRRFIQYVLDNLDDVQAECKAEYERLNALSSKEGRYDNHRIHNASVAVGIVAARWLVNSGIASSWNLDDTIVFLEKVRYSTSENIADLAANNVNRLLDGFRAEYGNTAVICREPNGPPVVFPDMSRVKRIAMRVDGDRAFLHMDTFREYCARQGTDLRSARAMLQEEYGECRKTISPVNFTRGLNTPVQKSAALMLPACAIMDGAPPVSAQQPDDNVVRMPGRS